MKISRSMSVLFLSALLTFFFSLNVSADTGIKEMKMPGNDSCEGFYLFIEGVCVHPTALREDADEMKAAIGEFKKTGKVPPMAAAEETDPGNEDPYCTRYKKRLEKYLRDGVMGLNTATGELEKMTGEAAERAIQNTRENVEIFCSN